MAVPEVSQSTIDLLIQELELKGQEQFIAETIALVAGENPALAPLCSASAYFALCYRIIAAQDAINNQFLPAGEGSPYLEPYVGRGMPPRDYRAWRLRVVGARDDDAWNFPGRIALQRMLRRIYTADVKLYVDDESGPNFLILHIQGAELEPEGRRRFADAIKDHPAFHRHTGR